MEGAHEVVQFLLPPREQAPKAVHPTVGALACPASRAVTGQLQGRTLLPAASDMIDHRHDPDHRSNVPVVVASVRAEVLRLLGARQRRQKRHTLEDRLHLGLVMLGLVMPVRSGYDQADRESGRFGEKVALCALFAAIGRIRAGGLPTKRGLRHATTKRLPLEIEANVGVVFHRCCIPTDPWLKAARRRPPSATPGIGHVRSKKLPAHAVRRSTECPFATHRKSQRRPFDSASEDVRRSGEASVRGEAAQRRARTVPGAESGDLYQTHTYTRASETSVGERKGA
jgi:hypothetical protein